MDQRIDKWLQITWQSYVDAEIRWLGILPFLAPNRDRSVCSVNLLPSNVNLSLDQPRKGPQPGEH